MPNNGVASVVSFLLNQQIITVEPAGLCFLCLSLRLFVHSFLHIVCFVPCFIWHVIFRWTLYFFLFSGVCIRMTTLRVWQWFWLWRPKQTLYIDRCVVSDCLWMRMCVCMCVCVCLYFRRRRCFYLGRCFWFPFRRIRAQSWLRSIPFQFNKHTHHTLELFRSYRMSFCMLTHKQTHTRTFPQQRRKTENQVNTRDNKKNFNFGLTTAPP